MIDRLSRFSRIILRHFLDAWERPTVPRRKLPKAIREAQEAEREALRRGCTRDVHAARQRIRQVRHDGLRREIYG